MTLNFPNNPSNGTVYSLANGATYTYDGTKWKASNIPDSSSVVQTNDNPADGEVLTYDGTLGAVVWSASSGGGGGVTVKEEGTALTTDASSLDFVGNGVVASGTTADKTITITDTNTTYSDFVGSNVGGTPTAGTAGLVPAPAGNQGYYFLRGDANWGGNATTSIPGLMSDADKLKLDGIPAGANIGIPSLADDPSPQLGASLDVNGNSISTAANNDNVVIAPHGTGALNVSSSKIINVTDPTSAQDAATKNYVDTSGISLTAAQTLENKTLDDYIETVNDGTSNAGQSIGLGGVTLTAASAHIHHIVINNTASMNITIDIDHGQSMLVRTEIPAAGSNISWIPAAGSLKWVTSDHSTAAAPVFSSSISYFIEFWKMGTITFGALVGEFS